MRRSTNFNLWLAAVVIVAFAAGCATFSQPSPALNTPHGRATFAMQLWIDADADVKAQLKSPGLSEARRNYLEEKRRVLDEIYEPVDTYRLTVLAGGVLTPELENKIIAITERLIRLTEEAQP